MPPRPPSAAELNHLRGRKLDKGAPVSPPLVTASMYHHPGDPDGSASYGRSDNSTWQATEHLLGYLEQAPALLFPSGMAAIAAPMFALLKNQQRLLIPSDGYYATRLLADQFLAQLGIEIDQRPTRNFAKGGFDDYAMVFIETPSNPDLDLCDLEEISAAARRANAITVADNTTMTPYGQRPLDLGIDIVVASDTKAPSGHSDILMGHVASRDENVMSRIEQWRRLSGSIPGPHEAWLLHRSLETLEMRFDRMCTSAEIIAARLSKILPGKVVYPGLPDHPDTSLAAKQMARNGFLIGLTLHDKAAAERFIDACSMLRPVTSFGGTHSSAERRARWGDDVAEGFVRISIGCEPVEELWGALESALAP